MGGREVFAQMVIPESYVWIVGPTLDLAEKEFRVAWRLIVEKGLIPVKRKSERELFIQCANGSFLECRSEDQPDQLIGEGLDLVVMAEAARLKLRTWDQYIRPALADRRGRAFMSSTPRGFNWFHDFYNRGQSEEKKFETWESWMIPSRANPLLDAKEIQEAKETSSPEAFAQEWEAKFIAYGGLVFPEFSEELHVTTHTYLQDMQTALWIDPGTAAPYAMLLVQITPDEEVRVLDELYRTGKTTDQMLEIAEDRWGEYILDRNGHPRTDIDVIVDKAAAEAAGTMRLRGYAAHGEKPTIKKGIEVHHQMLRDPLRSTDEKIVPRITFDRKCYNAIKEHGMYHYPDSARRRVEANPSEVPVDIDNHIMDALRYGYYNTWPVLFNEVRKEEDEDYEVTEYDDFDPSIREATSLGID